jgi:hypothetical protein
MNRLTKKIENPQYSNDYDMLCAHEYHVLNKLGKLEDLEEALGCPLEVLFKLVNQNELYYQFYNELQHWTSIKVDLRKKVVWYCKQVGGHYACSQPLSNYRKTFWLKEDKSE